MTLVRRPGLQGELIDLVSSSKQGCRVTWFLEVAQADSDQSIELRQRPIYALLQEQRNRDQVLARLGRDSGREAPGESAEVRCLEL